MIYASQFSGLQSAVLIEKKNKQKKLLQIEEMK